MSEEKDTAAPDLTALVPVSPGGLARSVDEAIDALELRIIEHPNIIDLPVEHRFTPGLYSRQLSAPAGTLSTTYIHKQEHQFVLLKGEVSVYADINEQKVMRVCAPYHGITKAGTRRVVFVHEDAVWTTFHPTSATTVEEAEAELYDFRTLPDGTNVRDRFREALRDKTLNTGEAKKEIEG